MSLPRPSELQQQLLNWNLNALLHPVPVPGKRGPYKRVFTPLITLWYFLFQRLNADPKQQAVVLDALLGGADALAEPGSWPSQALISSETGSYNEARQRLPESVIREIHAHSARKLAPAEAVGTLPKVQLMDGTLIAVLTNPELSEAYPPARNQHGTSAWSQIRCVAAFELQNGGVHAAAQAPTTTSEQALAWEIFAQSPAGTLSIGDSNFGVYSVAQAARHHRQHVLVRLTAVRAKCLGGSAHWTSNQEKVVVWKPTEDDQLHAGADATAVTGRLIFLRVQRPGFQPIAIWLFTTLLDAQEFTADVLLKLYGIRWRAETNFNYLKTFLKLKELTARSPEMARKEFYAGLIAYNLVREGMRCCAQTLKVSVTRVSFQAVRRALSHGLAALLAGDGGKSRRLKGLLLAIRTKVRPNEPREVRKRNQTYPPMRGSRSEARIRAAKKLAEACKLADLPANPTLLPNSL